MSSKGCAGAGRRQDAERRGRALLSRIDPAVAQPQALVVAPARELAVQILDVVKRMSQFTRISSAPVVRESVQRGDIVRDQVLVGTPGTIKDLLQRKAIPADHIKILVIDEADVMLDQQGMGDQTIRIRRLLPRECQLVLFSATYKEHVRGYVFVFFSERVSMRVRVAGWIQAHRLI